MRELTLAQSAREILSACADSHSRKQQPPFIFLIGSGVSHPPLPLASEVVDKCRSLVPLSEHIEPGELSRLEEYSYWLEAACPQPIQRRDLLRQIVKNQRLSAANLRLAHLLLSDDSDKPPIANVVATVNFDDQLSRALTLFGKRFLVCDHPATTIRVDPQERELVQIVHVHGTCDHYDLKNLRSEITDTANHSDVTVSTMASLLDTLFRSRSAVVVGYSGWEGDVVMNSLKRRLNGQTLAYNLYWFCYRRREIDVLPAWLREHRDVRLVAPSARLDRLPEVDKRSRGTREQDTLPARSVFEELIRVFELPAPRLTQDPISFYIEMLRTELPDQDIEIDASDDVYALRSLLRQLEGQRQTLADQSIAGSDDSNIETLSELVRRADYRAALRHGLEVDWRRLEGVGLSQFVELMMSSAQGLDDNSSLEIEGYKTVVDIATAGGPQSKFNVKRLHALYNLALCEEASGRLRLAVVQMDELLEEIPHTSSTVDLRMRAYGWRAGVSFNAGKYGEALVEIEKALTASEEAPDGGEPEWSKGWFSLRLLKADILQRLGRSEEASALVEEVIDRGEREASTDAVYDGLVLKADHLNQLAAAHPDRAEELLRRTLITCQQAENLRPNDGYALANAAYAYHLLGDKVSAAKAAEKAVRRGGLGLRESMIQDAERGSDQAYRHLVDSLWRQSYRDAASSNTA